jgi:hypothetical protein
VFKIGRFIKNFDKANIFKNYVRVRMKKFTLLICFLTISTLSKAEWTFFRGIEGGSQVFVDMTTLQNGANPKAWFLTNYGKPTQYGDRSSKVLYEANCEQHQLRLLAARFYADLNGKGAPSEIDDRPREWKYVTPSSMHQGALQLLCGIHK